MSRDWADSNYARLYHCVLTDPKFKPLIADKALFGWWTVLLIGADASYPASAPLPRSLPQDVLERLVGLGFVDLCDNDDLYSLSGLKDEREWRREQFSEAGKASVAGAVRKGGRFAKRSATNATNVSTNDSPTPLVERWTNVTNDRTNDSPTTREDQEQTIESAPASQTLGSGAPLEGRTDPSFDGARDESKPFDAEGYLVWKDAPYEPSAAREEARAHLKDLLLGREVA